MSLRTAIACCLTLAAAPAMAGFTMSVDSDLMEWLPTMPGGSSSDDWAPVEGEGIKYFVEDQTGKNTYLGPGWGGQDYDAEAVYAHRSATHLSFAIVTGRAPDAGGFVAGDIAIDFGLDGTFDYGVVTLTDAVGIGTAGELYAVTDWNYGLWSAPGVEGDPTTTPFGLSHPTSIKSGNKLADVPLSYDEMTYDGISGLGIGEFGDAGKHYVIETSIALNLLDPSMINQNFLVHWTMACANDVVAVDPPPGGEVPAPAPLLLLLAGLAGIGARRMRH